jgi:hypothetical protein
MLKNPNLRIKNLYNNICNLHNCNCLIADDIFCVMTNKKIHSLHILDASNPDTKIHFNNLPQTLEYLEIFNLNFDLTNLPIGLKKLCVISYKKFYIKVPFDCEYIERIMDCNPVIGLDRRLQSVSKYIFSVIGGQMVDTQSEQLKQWEKLPDPNTHTGQILYGTTKLIYELGNY